MSRCSATRSFVPVLGIFSVLRRVADRPVDDARRSGHKTGTALAIAITVATLVTIGRIPHCLSGFLRPQRRYFSKPARPHFWGLVMAIAMGTEHTIERLNALLRGHGHRTIEGQGRHESAVRLLLGEYLAGSWSRRRR